MQAAVAQGPVGIFSEAPLARQLKIFLTTINKARALTRGRFKRRRIILVILSDLSVILKE